MIYGAAKTKTEISGGDVPQQFSIQNSAIAFETLSSRLYTDPIRAVIRELSCNAYDAHVESGKHQEPFTVQLPTSFNPSFKIRDFGMGMDDREIRTLYCTYFGSSKNDSNSTIGAFGLGSKSPFAYFLRNGKTGGFSVISYQKGKSRIYTALIDQGFPKVRFECEANTTEPDGLEVIFPVEQKDVWEFENKAKVVFEFFSPLPKLNKDLGISRPEYTIEATKWGLRKNETTPQGNGVRAIMGSVAYAVGNIDISRMSDQQKRIFEMPLDMFFDIGEVNPAVSRENLQLDGGTIDAILKALDTVYEEMLEQVKKKINQAKNPWEGRMVIWNLLQHGAIGKVVNEAYNTGLLSGKFANFTLGKEKSPVIKAGEYSSIQVYRFEHQWRGNRKALRDAMLVDKGDEGELEYGFEVSPRVVFILDDLQPLGKSTKYVNYLIQKARDNDGRKIAYLVSAAEKNSKPGKVMEETSKLLTSLGNPPVTLASALQEKYAEYFPKRQAAPRSRGVLKFRYKSWYAGRTWRNAWENAGEDVVAAPGRKLFITVEGRKREGAMEFGISTPRNFHDLLDHLRQAGVFGIKEETVVFGLRKNAKLRKDPEWVELKGFVEETLKKVMTPAKEAAISLRVHPFTTDWDFLLEHIARQSPLESGSPLQVFAKDLADAKKAAGTTGEHLAQVLRNMQYTACNAMDFNKEWEVVKKVYPMLEICQRKGYRTGTSSDISILVGYARMVEQGLQKEKKLQEKDVPVEEKLRLRRERKARNQKNYTEKKRLEVMISVHPKLLEIPLSVLSGVGQ